MVPYLPYHTCYGIVWCGTALYNRISYDTIQSLKPIGGKRSSLVLCMNMIVHPCGKRSSLLHILYLLVMGARRDKEERQPKDKRIMRGLARPRSNLLVACFALSVWHGMVLYHTSVHDVLECLAPNPQCTSSCPAVATYSPAMTTLAVDAPTRSPDSRRPQLTLTLFRRCPIWGTA
jgi:hypothetical protein